MTSGPIPAGKARLFWDAENRITECFVNYMGSFHLYDAQGRRIVTVSPLYGVFKAFLYDGWNVIAEYNLFNATLKKTYLWGPDLSGSHATL